MNKKQLAWEKKRIVELYKLAKQFHELASIYDNLSKSRDKARKNVGYKTRDYETEKLFTLAKVCYGLEEVCLKVR